MGNQKSNISVLEDEKNYVCLSGWRGGLNLLFKELPLLSRSRTGRSVVLWVILLGACGPSRLEHKAESLSYGHIFNASDA